MSFAAHVERLKREFGRADEQDVIVTVATDFCNGGAPAFARAISRKGEELAAYVRAEDETLTAFRQRTRSEAQGLAGAARIVVGGLGASDRRDDARGLPRGAVTLLDIPLHASQCEAVEFIKGARCVAWSLAGVGARAPSLSRWRSTTLFRDVVLAYSRRRFVS
jgi:hypothetical protein